ncbi:MAG: hypothetical protein AAGH74_09165 [Pseudomonadota bacterium]
MKPTNLLLASAALGAAITLTPKGADAQGMVCGARAQIIKQLADRYGEAALSRGVARGSGIVETYVNPASGSWTIVVTNTKGMSCLMAAGEAFEPIEQPAVAHRDPPA